MSVQERGALAMKALSGGWMVVLAACSAPLTWDGVWVEDPAPAGSPELRRYKEEHYRALGRRIVGTLDLESFLREASASRVLFLGDQHSNHDLHRTQLRLLEELVGTDVDIVLAVEFVGTEDQADVDAFLDGRIDLDGLRARVRTRWPRSWLERSDLDSGFYRDLLRFGRRHSAPVHALEPVPRRSLDVRDAWMARRIGDLARRHPDALIVVVVGHAHLLGKGHLVDRTDLPSTVVGAGPNRSLAEGRRRAPDGAWFERTDTGALLFVPRD